jgi:hypothetical protein
MILHESIFWFSCRDYLYFYRQCSTMLLVFWWYNTAGFLVYLESALLCFHPHLCYVKMQTSHRLIICCNPRNDGHVILMWNVLFSGHCQILPRQTSRNCPLMPISVHFFLQTLGEVTSARRFITFGPVSFVKKYDSVRIQEELTDMTFFPSNTFINSFYLQVYID